MAKRRVKLAQCPNCNATLPNEENFCPSCGQENHNLIRPLKFLWTEVVENALNIDSRFFQTVFALFRYPGKITKEFNEGKRKKYLPPFRIYLFASLVFFLLQSIEWVDKTSSMEKDVPKVFDQFEMDSIPISLGTKVIMVPKEEIFEVQNYSDAKLDSLITASGLEPSWLYRTFTRQTSKAVGGNISGVIDLFLQNLSLAMFLLMPIFGLLLSLLFGRRGTFYIEHLIFSVHLHSAIFLLFSIDYTLEILFSENNWISTFFNIWSILYLFFSLKRVYEYKWGDTLLRSLGLITLYAITLIVAAVILILLSLLNF